MVETQVHGLVIPEVLYGRVHEVETLRGAFERVAANGPSTLVLVSGAAGTGKSSLVDELQRATRSRAARFASGKFDLLKRDVPYATIAQALEQLVRATLAEREEGLDLWREVVQRAIDPYGALVIGLAPLFERVLGPQPMVPEAPADQTHHRFRAVLRRLIAALAGAERPLVLFLDDLQWLDPGTLVLVEDLLADADVAHLLVVGAYRDNEVGADAALLRTRDALRARGVDVVEVSLGPLAPADVGQLMADALACSTDQVAALATLVHDRTAGNPLFVTQLVGTLADEGAVFFDPSDAAWRWDLDRIRTRGYADNVVELMLGKLHRLPAVARAALGDLACLGAANAEILAATAGVDVAEIHAGLAPQIAMGLVTCADEVFRFAHDRAQEAAYGLIDAGDRAMSHLRIGRVLAATAGDDAIFDIVNQLNRGAAQVTDGDERVRIAVLDLAAGKRAAATGALVSAATYFTAGLAILGDQDVFEPSRVRFELGLGLAECECMTGRGDAADERLAALGAHATSHRDRAAVARLRIQISTVLYRPDAVFTIGLEFLAAAGIDLPREPTVAEVDKAHAELWTRIGPRSIEQLIDIPEATDPDWIATLEVMSDLQPMVSFTSLALNEVLVTRMVLVGLEHGHCGASCAVYQSLMCVLAARGVRRQALRFGQLGFDLMQRRRLDIFEGRVSFLYAAFVAPWTGPLVRARTMLEHSVEVARRSGDLPFSIYALNIVPQLELSSGMRLEHVQRRIEDGLASMRASGYAQFADEQRIQLDFVLALRGALPVHRRDGDSFEARATAMSLDQRPSYVEYTFWVMLATLRDFARDHVGAIAATVRAAEVLHRRKPLTTTVSVNFIDHHLHGGLARAARITDADEHERAAHRDALVAHVVEVGSWAEHAPDNLGPMSTLLQAELARIDGRLAEAEAGYERAIDGARSAEMTHLEAIAAETAARCYRARGLESAALTYAGVARTAYERWGAAGVVSRLDVEYPQLRPRD